MSAIDAGRGSVDSTSGTRKITLRLGGSNRSSVESSIVNAGEASGQLADPDNQASLETLSHTSQPFGEDISGMARLTNRTSQGGSTFGPSASTSYGRPLRVKREAINYSEDALRPPIGLSPPIAQSRTTRKNGYQEPLMQLDRRGVPLYPDLVPEQQMQMRRGSSESRHKSLPSASSNDLGGYVPTSHPGEEVEEEDDAAFKDDDAEDDEYGDRTNNKRVAAKGNGSRTGGAEGGKTKGKGKVAPTRPFAVRRRRPGSTDEEYGEEKEEYGTDSVAVSAANTSNNSIRSHPSRAAASTNHVKHPNHLSPGDNNDKEASGYQQKVSGTASLYQPASSSTRTLKEDTQIFPDQIPDPILFTDENGMHDEQLGQLQPESYKAASNPKSRRPGIVHDSEEDAEGEDADPASEPLNLQLTSTSRGQDQVQAQLKLPVIRTEAYKTSSGRSTTVKHIVESDTDEEILRSRKGKGGARSSQARKYEGETSEGEGSYHDDAEDDEEDLDPRKMRRRNMERLANNRNEGKRARFDAYGSEKRVTRSRARGADDDDDDYEERTRPGGRSLSTETGSDEDEPLDLTDTESQDELMIQAMKRVDSKGRDYKFRKRAEVNYSLPAMFGLNPDGTPMQLAESDKVKEKPKKKKSGYGGPKHLPFSMSGKQLSNLFGDPPDSSDEDDPSTPKRNGLYGGPGPLATGGTAAMDFGAGTPSNLGKVSGATSKLFSANRDTPIGSLL